MTAKSPSCVFAAMAIMENQDIELLYNQIYLLKIVKLF